ncbi:MAG: DNA-binding response regulator, partial [Chitinophagia bacterium]|nr:DNA-binding response regulator [Chitinophagia bacterium]
MLQKTIQLQQLLIADRSPIFRLGMCSTFKQHFSSAAVFEAGNGDTLMQLFRKHRIDLLIMDDLVFETELRQLIKKLRLINPSTRILFFSDRGEEHFLSCMPRGGIYGYINKKAPSAQLIEAVETLAQGH